MSVKNENAAGGESVVLEHPAAGGVYASLFEKINLNPVSELSALDIWQDAQAMSDATADERLTAGMPPFARSSGSARTTTTSCDSPSSASTGGRESALSVSISVPSGKRMCR